MRHLRSLRLGSSRLSIHSQYRTEQSSPHCTHCGCPESTSHFLLTCHKFQPQRKVLFDSVRPILKKLNANLSSASLLGMFNFLKWAERERQPHTETSHNHTLK